MDVYAKNTVEFVTVAVEYCLYLEKIREKNREDLIDVMRKILPLLYLKASMVDKPESDEYGDVPTYVTEIQYEQMRAALAEIMGDFDDYESEGTPCSLSEDLSDLWQDLNDMAMNYKSGDREISEWALGRCLQHFETYWGPKLIQAMGRIHVLRFADKAEDND